MLYYTISEYLLRSKIIEYSTPFYPFYVDINLVSWQFEQISTENYAKSSSMNNELVTNFAKKLSDQLLK